MASDRQSSESNGSRGYSNQVTEDAHLFVAISGLQPTEDVVRAYWAGARGLLQYYEQFAAKIDQDIDPDKTSEWERGQLDGVRWVGDYLRNLFGL